MLRLRQMAFVARDRDALVDDLRAVLDLGEGYDDPHIRRIQLHNRVLPVGDQFIEVVAPLAEGITAERFLRKKGGDAGYMLIFQVGDHAARLRCVEELGIRVVARFDDEGFTNAQLHPADTGGAFFEIDQQEGDGWSPAGGEYRQWRQTEVADGIGGATIACADPAGVSTRWARLLGTEADGSSVRTDDAVIRFEESTDPAVQGIVGLDIGCVDVDRALRAASDRGLPVDGDVVHMGGVDLRLIRR